MLSVIIPSYNEEKDIAECLNSLKKQSYKNFEIILVDDGSTDKTITIAKKFSKVKILKQNHQGPGKARNLGAKNAKGSILIFVDSDMTFDKDYLKHLIKPLIEDKTGKIIGSTHDYEEAKNTHNIWSDLWGKIRISTQDRDPKIYAGDVKIFRAIWKKKFFELGGFDSKYGYADDQTFWFKYGIKPVLAKNTICYHNNPETLRATFKQARWIGASWKERYFLFKIPLISHLCVLGLFLALPVIIFIKAIKEKRKSKHNFDSLVKFYSYKFAGFATGIFRAVYLGKVWK